MFEHSEQFIIYFSQFIHNEINVTLCCYIWGMELTVGRLFISEFVTHQNSLTFLNKSFENPHLSHSSHQ